MASHLYACIVGAIWNVVVFMIFFFFVVLRAFFLLYMELILSIKVATKDFPLTPHHTILPGVTDMFFARRMRSTSKFAMTVLSKCVSHVGSTN